MSIERPVISVTKDGKTTSRSITEEDVAAAETRANKKARIARVLERGVVIDRATVELPPNLHGEWIHRDDNDIDRMKLLGFWIDGEEGHPTYFKGEKRPLHSDGTKVPTIGDTIFMVCDKDNKELIDEVRREQYEKMHGKPGETVVSQREEQGFKNTVQGAEQEKLTPVIEESRARSIKKDEIESVLAKDAKG